MDTSSLCQLAVVVLTTADTDTKAALTLEFAQKWRNGTVNEVGTATVPDKPARPAHVKVLPARDMPRRGVGTLENRIAMVHSLVHIESVAIDLSWDLIARFSNNNLPKEFYDDWVKVAEDEARHYSMLNTNIKELGSFYGYLPVHEGLWDSALKTSHDLLARLAIEHMVHEARGLDVTPKTIERFKSAGDTKLANLLQNSILPDEITHVAAGVKWFSYLCKQMTKNPVSEFIRVVPLYFNGAIKPPFNVQARAAGGMTEEWYIPLVPKSNKDSAATVQAPDNQHEKQHQHDDGVSSQFH